MPRTMNSEVSVFDFAGTVKDVKDAFTRDMVSENTETTTVASKSYSAGETFIWTDRKVYKAKSAIASGDTLSAATNGNIEAVGDLAGAVVENKEELESVSDLVDYMVNHQGLKNLLPNNATSITHNGITYTVNNDGTISVSGTATANAYILFPIISLKKGKYILSGCPDVNQSESKAFLYITSLSVFDYGNGAEFELLSDNDNINVAIRVNAGVSFSSTITFKPMIRPAEIEDPTYVPYAKSNVELTGAVTPMLNELGAKNLLPNNATSQVVNGITFTVNSDGSVTANGTSTGWSKQNLNSGFTLPAGKYRMSSGNTMPSKTYLTLVRVSDDATLFTVSGNREVEFSLASDTVVYVYVAVDSTAGAISNLTVYPMIRPASIEDDTYVPYAMTNRELTAYGTQFNKMVCIAGDSYIGRHMRTVRNDQLTFTDGKATKDISSFHSGSEAFGFFFFTYNANNIGVMPITVNNGVATFNTEGSTLNGQRYVNWMILLP